MISILLPDLRGGGVERIRLVLAEEFVRQGFTVEFVLLQARGELLAEAEARFPVRALGCKRLRQSPGRLARYLRERRPDALLAAMWPLTGIASLATRLAGPSTRLVVSEHNDFRHMPSLKYAERWALKRFGDHIYGSCHGIVAVSNGVAESLWEAAGLPKGRVRVIHNPARPMSSEPMAEHDRANLSGWLAGEARLLAIGALKRQKGFDVLLHALADLRQWRDARLLILGEGALRGELERLSAELGVADRVWFPGFRSNPRAFLQHADVFVLSSNWEGFGNVIVEALSAGVPVVSTDCPSGPAEILENGYYGRLVRVGNSGELSLAISESLSEIHDSSALNARAADFSVEKIAKSYLEVLLH